MLFLPYAKTQAGYFIAGDGWRAITLRSWLLFSASKIYRLSVFFPHSKPKRKSLNPPTHAHESRLSSFFFYYSLRKTASFSNDFLGGLVFFFFIFWCIYPCFFIYNIYFSAHAPENERLILPHEGSIFPETIGILRYYGISLAARLRVRASILYAR